MPPGDKPGDRPEGNPSEMPPPPQGQQGGAPFGRMPEFNKQLVCINGESLFSDVEFEDMPNDAPPGGGGGGPMPMREQNTVYKNLGNQQLIIQHRFLSRTFLVNDTLKPFAWKTSKETKTISGYVCQKATAKQDTTIITAWFANDLPVSNGPDLYWGLPGLILAIEGGDIEYTAIEVKTNQATDPIVVPCDGKKMNAYEYNRMKEEKLKEHRNAPGGGRPNFHP